MVDQVLTDLRGSMRQVVRAGAVSVFIVVALALAITANATVFSLLNATSLRKIAVRDPDGLVSISTFDTATGRPAALYESTFEVLRDQRTSLGQLSMYLSPFLLRGEMRGVIADLSMEGVSGAFFDLVGVNIVAGRGLTDEDDNVNSGPLACVLSATIWQRLLASDPKAIGEVVTIEGRPVTIVGVASGSFQGISGDTATDAWIPVAVARALSGSTGPARVPQIVGRLARGVTIKMAEKEILDRWPAVRDASMTSLPLAAQEAVRTQAPKVVSAARGFSFLRTQYERPVTALFILTIVFLAIGAVNILGLWTTRALGARAETAIKVALGVSRARLLRQAALEGILVALSALLIAIPAVWWLCNMLTSAVSQTRGMPLAPPLTPDANVIAVNAAIAVSLGIVVSLAPAWHASTSSHPELVRSGRSIGGRIGGVTKLLIVGQVALSMVLMVGAALFAESFALLEANQRQFRGVNTVFTRLARTPTDRTRIEGEYFRSLVGDLGGITSVQSAALSSTFPGYLGSRGPLPTDLYAPHADSAGLQVPALTEFVSPSFFATYDIPLIRGRDFTWDDDEKAPSVAIINQRLATRLFSSADAVGQRLIVTASGRSKELEIVAVVANATVGSVRQPDLGVVFRPIIQDLSRAQVPIAHVRLRSGSEGIEKAYIAAVQRQQRHFVRSVFSLDQWLNNALMQERLLYDVTMGIAGIALMLACLGIYAALSYSVRGRLREIAIRISLGAGPLTVVRLVMSEGLTLVTTGILVSIPCAVGVATIMRSQLFGVSPTDLRVVVGCALGFLFAGTVAIASPAWRASRTDPSATLQGG